MKTLIIIKRPVITEKTLRLAGNGFFTFEVHRQATKNMISKAVSSQFNVDVLRVATISLKGKIKRVGKMRTPSRQSDWKKAMVKLKKDQKIDLFDVGK